MKTTTTKTTTANEIEPGMKITGVKTGFGIAKINFYVTATELNSVARRVKITGRKTPHGAQESFWANADDVYEIDTRYSRMSLGVKIA